MDVIAEFFRLEMTSALRDRLLAVLSRSRGVHENATNVFTVITDLEAGSVVVQDELDRFREEVTDVATFRSMLESWHPT